MTQPSRRDALKSIKVGAPHAGLWLDRYLSSQLKREEKLGKDDKTGKEKVSPLQQLVDEVAVIDIPTMYKSFYQRWKATLTPETKVVDDKDDAIVVIQSEAKVRGRMVVGMGDESVIETAVTLHHTYGVPYIPGSALKGVAAAYTRQRLEAQWLPGAEGEATPYHTIFGDTISAGHITFYDAYYVPDSAEADELYGVEANQPLAADILTVHHQAYYQGSGPPADWDSPNPVAFLSARGNYLIAISGPKGWATLAFAILKKALNEYGVGAKTSSGYGRLTIQEQGTADDGAVTNLVVTETTSSDPDQLMVNRMIAAIENMPPSQVAGTIKTKYEEWQAFDRNSELKGKWGQAIFDKVKSNPKAEKTIKDKPWYQALLAELKTGEN